MKQFLDSLRFLILIICLFMYISDCIGVNVKKSVEENHDDENDDSMDIPTDPSEPSSNVSSCTRRKNLQMHEIRPASHGQFPFMAAIMSSRNEYICAGSIISNGLVLTTVQCTDSANYVLVNTTNDKKGDGTMSLHVIKTEKFPTYTGPNSIKKAAILYTEKHNNTMASKINISNQTSGFSEIEAIGFGLNADVEQRKELQYVGLDARVIDVDSITGFIDCIDTKVLTCFKDIGGPLVFENEIVGLITKGQDECTNEITSLYAINKRMVDALPIYTVKAWLDEKIAKNAEPTDEILESYPNKPIVRVGTIHRMTSSGDNYKIIPFYYVLILILFSLNLYSYKVEKM